MESRYYIDSGWRINTEGHGRSINSLTALALIPILGLLFVVFLPVIGFVLFGSAIISKASEISAVLLNTAPVGEVHLTGHDSSEVQAPSSELENLAAEIDARRK